MTLTDKLYKILIQGGSWKTILSGLWVTIRISEREQETGNQNHRDGSLCH